MNFKILDEGPADITDNSVKFPNTDSLTKLTITNKIKSGIENNQVEIIIGLIFDVKTEDQKVIYNCVYIGHYLLTIENSLTQEEFSNFYKRPYNSFKEYFDDYKKDKNLKTLTFPEFNADLKLTVKSFQDTIPDLIGILPSF